MVTNEAKEIIETAMKDPEFKKSMLEAFDFLDTIKKAYEIDNTIILKSVRNALDRRITELNIKNWFCRLP